MTQALESYLSLPLNLTNQHPSVHTHGCSFRHGCNGSVYEGHVATICSDSVYYLSSTPSSDDRLLHLTDGLRSVSNDPFTTSGGNVLSLEDDDIDLWLPRSPEIRNATPIT